MLRAFLQFKFILNAQNRIFTPFRIWRGEGLFVSFVFRINAVNFSSIGYHT